MWKTLTSSLQLLARKGIEMVALIRTLNGLEDIRQDGICEKRLNPVVVGITGRSSSHGKGGVVTSEQNEVIELMKKLGSRGHVVVRGDSVKVSLPFAEDVNPNITVWPNGAWRDFSGTNTAAEWDKLGLLRHGYLKDLRDAVGNRFPKMWNELQDVFGNSAFEYVLQRTLRAGKLKVIWGAIAFPIVDESNKVIGIQTRRIDGGEPKNQIVHGSDAKGGLFIGNIFGPDKPLLICEGATDTFTEVSDFNVVGAISSSLLGGLKKYLNIEKDVFSQFILAFDADDAGRNAQGEMLGYMLSIGIPREKISVMRHSEGNKDFNDEMVNTHRFFYDPIEEASEKIFVSVVDELSNSLTPGYEKALFVGFFPPDWVGFEHSTKPDGLHKLYVFPESYSRTEVNRQMYSLKASAYILKGW